MPTMRLANGDEVDLKKVERAQKQLDQTPKLTPTSIGTTSGTSCR